MWMHSCNVLLSVWFISCCHVEDKLGGDKHEKKTVRNIVIIQAFLYYNSVECLRRKEVKRTLVNGYTASVTVLNL